MQRRQFVTLASHTTAVLAAPVFMRNAWAQEGGITGKTLTIGCSAALSGPLAGFGQDIKQGAEAALAHINGRGGVHGRTLQFNNSNRLVKNPEWEIGLQKTGYISEAGRCLVMQARVAGRQLIMVFLDATGKLSRLQDAERVRRWVEHSREPFEAVARPQG